MKLFSAYIRQRQKGILAFFLFCAIFAASFILYHLPVGAVVYPTLFCVLLGCVFVFWDFSHAKQKHEALLEIQNLTAAMMDSLPEAHTIEDGDYQAILRALKNEVIDGNASASARYQDMVEY